ncbi:lycopene cyclase family protein [Ornithinimicrobium pratense]|uniref:Lycopene cyclase n=1 Tax=Ornithinimicrobium pratense TaxID=2593973 RepID=A0A5J6V1F5_9MICO|nr:lycopene cyclase family protein [Ornithinimicrobium pratense]QFG67387.1 lycopene cyclase [Ornithinimicrobium pratense]
MVDVAVVGLGPAGRALASRLVARGASVLAVDPRPQAVWTPTYGVWAEDLGDTPAGVIRSLIRRPEIRAHGHHVLPRRYAVLDNAALQRALPLQGAQVRAERLTDEEVVALRREAAVVVDARGARPAGPRSTDPAPAQTAYGIVVPAAEAAPALGGAEGLIMDWRTDWAPPGSTRGRGPATFLYAIPLGDGTVLLEETCLAAAPGLPVEELKARLRRRLLARGMGASAIEEPLAREVVRIPMRGRGRKPPGGVLAVGTAGRGGNIVTGYSVTHSLLSADALAARIVQGRVPRQVDPLGPSDAVREAGLRALLRLDVEGTLDLFDAFGRLPGARQRAFWSREARAGGMAASMWGMFTRMPPRSQLELARATLGR